MYIQYIPLIYTYIPFSIYHYIEVYTSSIISTPLLVT